VSLITFLRKIGKINDNLVLAYTLERGKKLSLLSLFYVSNVILALFALSGMNIPMYNAMRRWATNLDKFFYFSRCVPIASLLLGPCIYPQRSTTSIILAIVLITAGTITAAQGDLDFDFKSYTFGSLSVLTQVEYFKLKS